MPAETISCCQSQRQIRSGSLADQDRNDPGQTSDRTPWRTASRWFIARSLHVGRRVLNGISTWVYSIAGTLCVPLIPILIEYLKFGKVDKDIILVTAAILAATFFFTASNNLCRAIYFLSFLVTIVMDTLTLSAAVLPVVDAYAVFLLGAVALLHGSERFWWHVVLDIPFPEQRPR